MKLGFIDRLVPAERILRKQELQGTMPKSSEVLGQYLRLAWPSVTECVLIGLISFADTAMVGAVGDEAIKAVGICAQPRLLLLTPTLALGAAMTALSARRTGEGRREDVNRVLRVGFLLGMAIMVVLAALGAIFAEPFLRLAGAADSYMELAMAYFRIICIATLFTTANSAVNAVQRGSGNTRIPMTSNIIGNLVNILFNWLLIGGVGPFPRLGVQGAAIATTMGGAVSLMVSSSLLLKRENYVNLWYKCSWRFSRDILKPLAKVGTGAVVEDLSCRVGFFLVAMMNARLPGLDYTAHVAASQVTSLSYNFVNGFGVACAALAGQYLGQKRSDKAFLLSGIARRVVMTVSLMLAVCFITMQRGIMGLFTETEAVIDRGAPLMYIAAIITFCQGLVNVSTGCLRGAGDTRYTGRVYLISVAVIRPIMCYLMVYVLHWGLWGSWLAMLLDQLLRTVLFLRRAGRGEWLKIKL